MTRPEDVTRRLVALLAERDMDGVAALYEPQAVFAELDGVSRGSRDIRTAHQRFVDSGLTLILEECVALETDDLALVHWAWTVHDEEGFSARGVSAEVLRRQADGEWKFIIDNSDGAALIGLI